MLNELSETVKWSPRFCSSRIFSSAFLLFLSFVSFPLPFDSCDRSEIGDTFLLQQLGIWMVFFQSVHADSNFASWVRDVSNSESVTLFCFEFDLSNLFLQSSISCNLLYFHSELSCVVVVLLLFDHQSLLYPASRF